MKINFIKLLYEEENNMKNNKGITLVALVVTIVVLLILAGVSINLVLGNNGIIAKAKDAETKSAEASQNDLKGMSDLEDEMDKQLGTCDPLKKIPTKTTIGSMINLKIFINLIFIMYLVKAKTVLLIFTFSNIKSLQIHFEKQRFVTFNMFK